MGKKEQLQTQRSKVEAVLEILRHQSPLSLQQEKFCDKACIERFLKAKEENVKKAAKQLRSCLTWRDRINAENMIADEFSAELSEGVAYVAGHDNESRPVMIFRIKQDYHKLHSHRRFTRLVAFTLEVAIQTMPKHIDQFVILFDACYYRSAAALMNSGVLPTLKLVGECYPTRLYKAFIIHPPSLLSYLWKSVRPFVELSNVTTIVSSTDFDDSSISLNFNNFEPYGHTTSLRYDPSTAPTKSPTVRIGSCTSSRFCFTPTNHFHSLKPWHLTFTHTSSFKLALSPGPDPSSLLHPTHNPTLFSATNDRSFSYLKMEDNKLLRKNFIPSTPLPRKLHSSDATAISYPRTPNEAALFFGRQRTKDAPRSQGHVSKTFLPYLEYYKLPYNEMRYRSKIKPPLGGLISIVNFSQIKRQQHVSVSQRF